MPPSLADLLALLRACRAPDHLADYPSPADLAEILALPATRAATRAATRLWLNDSGSCIAFAIVDAYANLWFEVLPQAQTPEIHREIVAWAVTTLAARLSEAGALDTNCREDDIARRTLLEANGFVAQPLRTLTLLRRLDEPLPDPVLPAGFLLRHVAGSSEAPALLALHHAAFGAANLSLEERLAWMAPSHYEPELDLVIEAPHGALVASCFCAIAWDDAGPGAIPRGTTDPVAVHPDFQRRGLARALLVAGMRRLAARGISEVTLSTTSDNVAMQHTAQAAGYRVETVKIWYQKALIPGSTGSPPASVSSSALQ